MSEVSGYRTFVSGIIAARQLTGALPVSIYLCLL